MPLPADTDASTPKFLRDKYAILGVGETTYTRGSGKTTRALGTWAVRNAIEDAGLKASDVDGMLSYQSGDSTFGTFIAGDLGIRLNFYMDVFGGGSSTEALVGIAIGVIEAGLCKTVVIFRAMNGFSQVRIGGTGARSVAPVTGDMLHSRAYGWQSAGQLFSFTFLRHMHDYGTTPAQVAAVRAAHSGHASNNPKAYYKKRVTVEEVLASRIICKPLHLLDCCVETDNATAIIVTRADRAKDWPASSRADPGRGGAGVQAAHRHAPGQGPISTVAWNRCARDPVAQCGRRPRGRRCHRLLRRVHLPPPCCSWRTTASARGEAASTSATARSAGRPAAQQHQRRAICARAIPTA
jgi:acetyl-CoA acetyltransferase